ncbi:MAG: type II secretion system protein GspM [Pseudomonadota bacterium]
MAAFVELSRQRHLSRLVAVGILALLLATLVFGVLVPLMDGLRSRHARIAALRDQLSTVRQLAAARDELTRQKAELEARRKKSGLLLAAGSEALAAATLQNMVKTAVARAGGELRTTQSLPATGEAGMRRMAVRAHLSTDMDGLRAFLHAVEGGAPILFVEDLDIRARASGPQDAVTAPVLDVRIDLVGLLGGE